MLQLMMAALALLAIGIAAQAQTCPDSETPGTERPVVPAASVDFSKIPIQFSFDGGDSVLNGKSELFGAKAVQGNRSISADTLHYDFSNRSLKADGNVMYEDSQVQVSGNDASMDSTTGVQFDQAGFALKQRAGHGSASRIQLTPQGNLQLDDVRYTTCPENKPDWELKLSELDINQSTRTGTGRNARLEFKNIPLFYTPWISFPVGNERKSGFLPPNLQSSSRGGYSLLIPWYWNIAPNYDATLTPIIDTRRGAELNSEFRYLTELSNGTVTADYLPHDSTATQRRWRGLVQLQHVTDFTSHLRLKLDGTDVSDNQWFEDFGQNRDETSQVYLIRNLNFSAYSANWQGSVSAQNMLILDKQIKAPLTSTAGTAVFDPRPYTVLPRISVAGREDELPYGLDFNFAGELTYFTRSERNTISQNQPDPNVNGAHPNVNGARLFLEPGLSLPLQTPGMYVIPTWRWRYSAYQLSPNETYAATTRSPVLSAPISSVDMAMTFEKTSADAQRLYTLQPRILYAYVPFRKQSDVPVFDTGLPDFNLIQLFDVDRFIGPDRLGDTNQISAGITTRMMDSHSGRQFLSGTLGQAFYLTSPCVIAVDSPPDTCDVHRSGIYHSSPVIGQVALSAYKNWSASVGMQWDPVAARTDRSEVNFQYLPGHNKVINIGYRFTRTTGSNSDVAANSTNPTGRVDQWETSFAWPVGVNWSTYGRVVYSRVDNQVHDYLAGLEYRSCCWNLRLVLSRSVTTREGFYDTRLNLQFELKGLGNAGSAGSADTSLQNAIPGYSSRPD